MSTQPQTRLTPEEYLAIERRADFRSEYLDGEMFAMAGASVAHNLLVGNLYGILRARLPRGKSHVYVNDMRVHVAATGLFTYPDVVVACEERRYLEAQKDTLVTPVLIAEVLSDSTEAYDRGRKFEHYQTIETLRQYVLVAQDRVHVDVYTRHDGGRWLLKSYRSLDEVAELPLLEVSAPLAELYQDVG